MSDHKSIQVFPTCFDAIAWEGGSTFQFKNRRHFVDAANY